MLVKKKSKLELEQEAAASAPRQVVIKKQTPKVRANAHRSIRIVSRLATPVYTTLPWLACSISTLSRSAAARTDGRRSCAFYTCRLLCLALPCLRTKKDDTVSPFVGGATGGCADHQ